MDGTWKIIFFSSESPKKLFNYLSCHENCDQESFVQKCMEVGGFLRRFFLWKLGETHSIFFRDKFCDFGQKLS